MTSLWKLISISSDADHQDANGEDESVHLLSREYKPISTREYFKLLGYCMLAFAVVIVITYLLFNFVIPE